MEKTVLLTTLSRNTVTNVKSRTLRPLVGQSEAARNGHCAGVCSHTAGKRINPDDFFPEQRTRISPNSISSYLFVFLFPPPQGLWGRFFPLPVEGEELDSTCTDQCPMAPWRLLVTWTFNLPVKR